MRMRLFGRCFLASRAWAVLWAIALEAPGCFVTIADPAIDSTGGRPNAGTGGGETGAPSSGGFGGGGAGSGGVGGAAGDGSACPVCALANVKTYGCSNAACTIVECEPGYVDCDGDAMTGCETDFHVEAADAATGAAAPKAKQTIKLDGEATEWSSIPSHPMNQRCTACDGLQPGGQNGEPIVGEPADDSDLTAAFRLTWDESALYVFAQVHDDQVSAREVANVERQDGIELLVNGNLNDINNQYSPDVHHLFVGALAPQTANVVERNQQLQSSDLRAATQVAAHCYFVEMSLSWPYVMGRMPHPPVTGETHGFTIATNDWDRPFGSEAGAEPERQTQYFWVVPGKNYSYETTAFGIVTLDN